MFYVTADITIQSRQGLMETGRIVAAALDIPEFVRDESGRWEEQEVFVSKCFGLRFAFGHPIGDPEGQFGLSIDSSTDAFEYDGKEQQIDATRYTLAMLRNVEGIRATAD